MMQHVVVNYLLVLCFVFVLASCDSLPNCTQSAKFFCVNEKRFLQCVPGVSNGDSGSPDASQMVLVEGTCGGDAVYSWGKVCSCASCSTQPCLWDHEHKSDDCPGSAGQVAKNWDEDNLEAETVFHMASSQHVPLVLHLDEPTWRTQLGYIVANDHYDNVGARDSAASNYRCSLHPPVMYDYNPTQLWIGFPEGTLPATLARGKGSRYTRLPDAFTGMVLGFCMDMYGINPSMLLGLLTYESMATITSNPANFFVAPLFGEVWRCSDNSGGNADETCDDYAPLTSQGGPMQISKSVLCDVASVIPQRFHIAPPDGKTETNQPVYMSHQYYCSNPHFNEYYTALGSSSLFTSVILAALELHAHHTPAFLFDQVGMRYLWSLQPRNGMDAIEFAVAVQAHNSGLFDPLFDSSHMYQCYNSSEFENCAFPSTCDQINVVRKVCKLFDQSAAVYDYPIYWTDVESFITQLHAMYPYLSVTHVHSSIQWTTLLTDSLAAFQMLADHRASQGTFSEFGSGPSQGAISLRFDWRALCAVIRMHLPAAETLMGPTLQAIARKNNWQVAEDIHYVNTEWWWPNTKCEFSGTKQNVCSDAVNINSDGSDNNSTSASNHSNIPSDESPHNDGNSISVLPATMLLLQFAILYLTVAVML